MMSRLSFRFFFLGSSVVIALNRAFLRIAISIDDLSMLSNVNYKTYTLLTSKPLEKVIYSYFKLDFRRIKLKLVPTFVF